MGARLRAAKAVGEGAKPKPKKVRKLGEGASDKAAAAAAAAEKPAPKALPKAAAAVEAELAAETVLPGQAPGDAAATPAADAAEADGPPEEPASLFSQMAVLWAVMIAACLGMLARRLLPCCKRAPKPKGGRLN